MSIKQSDPIHKVLLDLHIIDDEFIEEIFPRTRDREDISVLRCKRSGVIFLSSSDHITYDHYISQDGFNYWSSDRREKGLKKTYKDDLRRYNTCRDDITSKIWADVGTGLGGILEILNKCAEEVHGVELQRGPRESLQQKGFSVYPNSELLPNNYFDVITLFHVFEHFVHPLNELKVLLAKLKSSGKIIIEIPHANDFLISFLESKDFKSFTFWSEHLILHTRESIRVFLEHVGFKDISIKGIQRYPLSNHLFWLKNGQPDGHEKWSHLNSLEMEHAYANMLTSLDKTDTLFVTAFKR